MDIGLGVDNYRVAVYIANRPPLREYERTECGQLQQLRPALPGELADIVHRSGNHWRKIFNIFAKICYALWPGPYQRWQDYRDHCLLQPDCHAALLFSAPNLLPKKIVEQNLLINDPTMGHQPLVSRPGTLHIVTGKTYAEQLGLLNNLDWRTECLACQPEQRLIIAPYFDYRQLSNAKLSTLLTIIKEIGI